MREEFFWMLSINVWLRGGIGDGFRWGRIDCYYFFYVVYVCFVLMSD